MTGWNRQERNSCAHLARGAQNDSTSTVATGVQTERQPLQKVSVVFTQPIPPIVHDRFGSSSDPSLNVPLHYPNDIDRSINEATTDKIRKYRADYNNNPPSAVYFMPDIASTSGRLHSEFIRLLFLQSHRETDRFFAASGVQLAQSTSGLFHFRRVVFSSKVDSTLAKAAALRINLNIDVHLSLQERILTHLTRTHLVY